MRSNNYLLYISYTRQTFENLLVLIILHWKKVLHVVCAVTFFYLLVQRQRMGLIILRTWNRIGLSCYQSN